MAKGRARRSDHQFENLITDQGLYHRLVIMIKGTKSTPALYKPSPLFISPLSPLPPSPSLSFPVLAGIDMDSGNLNQDCRSTTALFLG